MNTRVYIINIFIYLFNNIANVALLAQSIFRTEWIVMNM